MIDVLLKHNISYTEILNFLSKILECAPSDILLISQDIFNETASLYEIKTMYLCIFFEVFGEASNMLEIYRSDVETEELSKRAVRAAQNLNISCYIPFDDFNQWIYIDEDRKLKLVKQIEFENEKLFYFRNSRA